MATSAILVIDDNPDDRAEMRRALLRGSERQFRFTEADTGKAALQLLTEAGPFDCTLLDFHLPDYDAPELLERLGGPDALACPIVVVTGDDASPASSAAALRAGAHEYIGKSWLNPESLARIVENAVERFTLLRQLRDSNARYRALFENIRSGYAHWRLLDSPDAPDFECLAVNPGLQEMLRSPNLVGRRLTDIVPKLAWDNPELVAAMRRTADTGNSRQFETHIRSLGMWLAISIYCPRLGECVTLFDDIGERKEAERASRELNAVLESRVAERTAELAKSEERFRLAMNASTDGLWDWHTETGDVYFSPGYLKMLGFEPRELPYRLGTWIDLLHPAERATVVAAAEERLRSPGHFELEFRMRTKQDDYRWILSRGKTVQRDSVGLPERAVGTHTDITERKRYEALLGEAKRQADSANQAKSAFLAHMSHEIRTPLNAVLGYCHLLQQRALDAPSRELVRKLGAAGNSLLALINAVLDFSKIEAGRMDIADEPFQLAEAVDQVVALSAEAARTKGLELTCRTAALPGPVRGDALRLRQVLLNLLNNAIKFTGRGRVELDIGVVAQSEREVRLRFGVRDTGIGISPHDQAEIFAAFSQAETSIGRRHGGSGLGLTISRQLVELMGGTLEVLSALGEGSEFFFVVTFPWAQQSSGTNLAASDSQAPNPEPPAGSSASPQRLQGIRALVVDDNEINREVAQLILEGQGASVATAADGQAALAWLTDHAEHVDVILMDLQMPGMDGYTATQYIRNHPRWQSLPVIALTAEASTTFESSARTAGMNAFVPKPFSVDQLIDCILRVTAQRSAGASEQSAREATEAEIGATPSSSIPALWRDRESHERYLRRFAADYGRAGEVLETHLQNGDLAAAGALVHQLIGVAGTLGLGLLQSAAKRFYASLSDAAQPNPTALRQALVDTCLAIERSATTPRQPDIPAVTSESQGRLTLLHTLLEALDRDSPRFAEPILEQLREELPHEDLDSIEEAISAFDFRSAEQSTRALIAALSFD